MGIIKTHGGDIHFQFFDHPLDRIFPYYNWKRSGTAGMVIIYFDTSISLRVFTDPDRMEVYLDTANLIINYGKYTPDKIHSK